MNYSISESEWKIMRVLWDHLPMPLGELIALVGPENNWNGNTVRTLLVRLVEKGAVKAEKRGRNYLYSALAQENECVMQEMEHFLKRIFDGSPARLFAALSAEGKLSERDCQEIEAMLQAMKGRERYD